MTTADRQDSADKPGLIHRPSTANDNSQHTPTPRWARVETRRRALLSVYVCVVTISAAATRCNVAVTCTLYTRFTHTRARALIDQTAHHSVSRLISFVFNCLSLYCTLSLVSTDDQHWSHRHSLGPVAHLRLCDNGPHREEMEGEGVARPAQRS